jgi:hypothetical protein
MKTGTRTRRRGESGFALLLVFVMAAAVAIMLYMELPRVAFEAQRNKEALLIERGEQYKRAIQLYFRKFKTYPASLDALENTNNIRFLRRRYSDPLTGKDEWRLIHVGPGGVFTDSITRKPKTDKPKEANTNTFITEGPPIGSTLADTQHTTAGPPRRRGEQLQPGSDGNAAAAGQPGADQQPGDVGNALQPGAGQPVAGQPSVPTPGGAPVPLPGIPGIPGSPFNPAQPAGTPSPVGTGQTPGNTPLGTPGIDPNQPGADQAAALIRNLLTNPRPFPGGAPGAAVAAGPQISVGSIAGVASKVEKPSIKIYNDRDKYNEWEFIYDFGQDRTGAGRMAGGMQPGGQPTPGMPGMPGTPGFPGQPGLAGQPGAGSQPGDTSAGSNSAPASSWANPGVVAQPGQPPAPRPAPPPVPPPPPPPPQ